MAERNPADVLARAPTLASTCPFAGNAGGL
jgi:hypothetical protein